MAGFFKRFSPLAVIKRAQNAIELIVITVHPELVEGSWFIERCAPPFVPAAYHRAVVSESFLKTHAIQETVN
jgi:hypothetical protein